MDMVKGSMLDRANENVAPKRKPLSFTTDIFCDRVKITNSWPTQHGYWFYNMVKFCNQFEPTRIQTGTPGHNKQGELLTLSDKVRCAGSSYMDFEFTFFKLPMPLYPACCPNPIGQNRASGTPFVHFTASLLPFLSRPDTSDSIAHIRQHPLCELYISPGTRPMALSWMRFYEVPGYWTRRCRER